jgi:starch phosphorylase
VELVAEASDFGPRVIAIMKLVHPLSGSKNTFLFEATVPTRPEGHYTPRLRPRDARLNLPLENPAVLWMK